LVPAAGVTLPADGSACLIVVATIPPTATNAQIGLVNIIGTSVGSQTLGYRHGVQTDGDNWAQALVTTGANLTANKSANPAGNVNVEDTIAYTITGSNNGGGPASGVSVAYVPSRGGEAEVGNGILVYDQIPANTAYVPETVAGVAGGGTIPFRTLVSSDGGSTWYDSEGDVPGTIDAVAVLFEGVDAFFPQAANYQVTFSVTVTANATAGTTIANQGFVDFNDGTDDVTTPTNTTSNTVNASYAVAVGPFDKPVTNDLTGQNTYTDPVTGLTWLVDLSGSYSSEDDTQTTNTTVHTGQTVSFRQTLQNIGNSADSYILTASQGSFVTTLYRSDGVTPLSGPIGPVPAGGTYDFVVKVQVPVGAPAVDYTTVVTATSVASDASDITTDVILAPQSGYAVDIGARGFADGDDIDDDVLGAYAGNPGTTVQIPIEVYNFGSSPDTYLLSSSLLPTGWTVTYSVDVNCDGSADGPTVTTTGILGAGVTACFIANVTIPAGAPAATEDISFTATGQTGGATNTVTGTVSVNTVPNLVMFPDQTGTTSPGGVVTYTHTVQNLGNASATVTIPAQGTTDFTYLYAIDSDNDGDFSDETFYTSLEDLQAFILAAGASQTVFVRVLVPPTAVNGAEETVTVTATGTYAGPFTDSASVIDRTIVQAGELDLFKSVRTCADAACDTVIDATGATAQPGDYLEYIVVASNIGLGDLTEVKISDPLPGSTTYGSASATTSIPGTVLYSIDGTTWATAMPTPAPAPGTLIYVGVDTSGDTSITNADVMGPARTITLKIVVQVN
ncbi:MAG: DUF11 domain-containing protein, partial [Trueperaceae bacterium]|nr:DUF11 domain-containing protein [Trueperaceae bacterium]